MFYFTRLSRKWFSHVFIFIVLMGYTALGAALFIAVEAPHETVEKADMVLERTKLIKTIWNDAFLVSKNFTHLEQVRLFEKY